MSEPASETSGARELPATVTSRQDARQWLERFAADVLDSCRGAHRVYRIFQTKLGDVPTGAAMLKLDRDSQTWIVREGTTQIAKFDNLLSNYGLIVPGLYAINQEQVSFNDLWEPRQVMNIALAALLKRKLPLDEADVLALVRLPTGLRTVSYSYPMAGIAAAAEAWAKEHPLSDELTEAITDRMLHLRRQSNEPECRRIGDRLQALLGPRKARLEPGEAWSDAAINELQQCSAEKRAAWNQLLVHCQSLGAGKPSQRWLKQVVGLVDAVGRGELKKCLLEWLPLTDKPRTQLIPRTTAWETFANDKLIPAHVDLLRGLVRCAALDEDAELSRAVGRMAMSCYRKLPMVGPRLPALGNACIGALGSMPGRVALAQLAILQVKIKSNPAQKEIGKAFVAAAERESLARDEIEELVVPSYGLTAVGLREDDFGEYQAVLQVDGSCASLSWRKSGKQIKSVPAAVKEQHSSDLKELKADVKDLNAMLPVQRQRLDTLFLADRTWTAEIWRERYLDHPLIGTIARRLIWTVESDGQVQSGCWHDGDFRNRQDESIALPSNSVVRLWHPIGQPVDEVLAWREWLEGRGIVQPFKQAHREVYLLTEAERRTGTYSNRFAAHLLRQHQFNALCAARGWKNQLRLLVDADYPPASRLLPAWNLRAEYWIEGVGDDYAADTNQAGAFLRVTTDQVRFYQADAAQLRAHAGGGGYGAHRPETAPAPMRLDQIPPLVFSEILRDVDLFVGVASVANDSTWSDGGPNGRDSTYWRSYSTSELSTTAQTRRTLLERLLPRLKIASRCVLDERYLIVRGDMKTYKIHLGSGNILMSPNDQYLCIVAKQSMTARESVMLPFEGDTTLTIILSKAFLLADDTKIKDETILQQLRV